MVFPIAAHYQSYYETIYYLIILLLFYFLENNCYNIF